MDEEQKGMVKMYNIGICDDERDTCVQITNMIQEYSKKNKAEIEVSVWHTGEALYADLTKKIHIDLLFLDSKRTLRREEFLRFRPFLHNKSVIIWHDSSYRHQNHAVFDAVNELYEAGVIDRLLLPTPRGIMLKEGGLML